ncbi:MAG TPA: acyltransferase [Candidatus Aquilonibacter sp.]|nr:acyltransferase [Candidatus Aquilonibacter sp.]
MTTNNSNLATFEDPIFLIPRTIRKLNSLWLRWTYPFVSIGSRVSVHPTCDLRRAIAPYIRLGGRILLEKNVRVDVVVTPRNSDPVIIIEDGCVLGQRVTILGINRIHIEPNVIFGPSVLVTDHNHAFEDVTVPISQQGAAGGTVRIEEGCWIGFGTAIVASQGELVIGRNSVIGVNSVVTRSIPPYSVVAGNPARVVKQYDVEKKQWVIGSSGATTRSQA